MSWPRAAPAFFTFVWNALTLPRSLQSRISVALEPHRFVTYEVPGRNILIWLRVSLIAAGSLLLECHLSGEDPLLPDQPFSLFLAGPCKAQSSLSHSRLLDTSCFKPVRHLNSRWLNVNCFPPPAKVTTRWLAVKGLRNTPDQYSLTGL